MPQILTLKDLWINPTQKRSCDFSSEKVSETDTSVTPKVTL